jgi:hypothetical protein
MLSIFSFLLARPELRCGYFSGAIGELADRFCLVHSDTSMAQCSKLFVLTAGIGSIQV